MGMMCAPASAGRLGGEPIKEVPMYAVLVVPAVLMIGSLLLERLERRVPVRLPRDTDPVPPLRPESGVDGGMT